MDKKKDENPEEVREAEKKKTIKQLNSLLSLFKIRAKNLRWCKEEIIKKAEDLYNALRNED
jgi:hypothetical protein